MGIPHHSHKTEAQGGLIDAQQALTGVADLSGFGDGSDGAGVIAGPTTLTRSMFWESLVIEPGGSIDPAGFEIFVRTSVTVQNTGFIASDGADAITNTGGVTVANGELDGRQAGGDAGTNAVGSPGVAGDEGGGGGDGGAGGANAGGIGGSADNPSSSQVRFRAPGNAVVETGGGGGGGGGDATGTGGGGGASGGEVSIHAPVIRVDAGGRLSANGGDGADGGGANGGGGGGGGGGKVRLNFATLVNNGLIEALGGAAGAGSGTGAAGTPGTAGIVELVQA